MKNILSRKTFSKNNLIFSGLIALGVLIVGIVGISLAKPAPIAKETISPMHPSFAILDNEGKNVLDSEKAMSATTTCGACHDTAFIASHSFHSDLGLSSYKEQNGLDSSQGLFGDWDPLSYRYLSQSNDERIDLGTADWIIQNASRFVGGGPGMMSRSGSTLDKASDLTKVEANVLDPKTGKEVAWDWKKSGTVEMDCFLCHLSSPNISERTAEIQAGKFGSSTTATLLGSGIVERKDDGFMWSKEAFNQDGTLKKEYVQIQDPVNDNCAACHGEVHTDTKSPITVSACDSNYPLTYTTGQVISSQKISESGVNLTNKSELARSFDIHAERALECTDCHYAINNPIHSQEAAGTSPSHLKYDPRKLTIGEYLQNPEHNFARGQSAQYLVAPEYKGTMRRCESCHDAQKTHQDWLPYTEQHMSVVACESCHIPKVYAPALEMVDWTFLNQDGTPGNLCRGINGTSTITDLVSGYSPVLMQRNNIDGTKSLTPYNLISSWYWVYVDANGNNRPVRKIDLDSVFTLDGKYLPDVITKFDTNGDGSLSSDETKLTTDDQVSFVAAKLAALGLTDPHIEGQVQPYNINHGVTGGEFVVRDCKTCHNSDSKVSSSIQLSSYVPGNVIPTFVDGTNVNSSGEVKIDDKGYLQYSPKNTNDHIYVFGKDANKVIDWFGALALLATVFGVAGHGTLRYIASSKMKKTSPKTESVYIYEVYERFWHWLQAVSILALVLTGLIIHRPDMFGAFSFQYVVVVHNVFAGIVVINAALSLFWHLTTGEIKQYIPRPVGFFDDAIVQAKYYVSGIFKGEPHPFEKKKQRKMNPLQQATYFGLLNVLLPLQIITGSLIWALQKWPTITNALGGLQNLAVFHSLIAWLLASFIIAHIYLTTTGATPLEAMRGMVTGWEELEIHPEQHEKKEK